MQKINTSETDTTSDLEQAYSSQDSMVKHVTFNEIVQCRKTISREDYTELEAHQSWLSREEMAKMTERQFKTAARMESGKESKRESTYRGLECLSAKGEAELNGVIQYCIDAVMDENDRQFDLFEKIQDSEMIALASMACSAESIQKAMRRGESDAREAKRCYRRMRDMEASAGNNNNDSTSSFSVSDEHPSRTIPILKTGNAKGDICESALPQTQQVMC
ncbi:unnamed protein product [Cylindrotheca closterium]|uniref:Uncharacterized protein n=1 Tax=Cylindrotheca closterium TaxID=2856 RepID=A0AAD2FLX3_9STRA|nr:unnamed protein product [Cylindrotheca closterium]